ncbi:MAG: DUF2336 domain-containing protein [Aliidongia sp.]
MKGLIQRVFSIGKLVSPIIGYEESKQLVQSRNPADRRKVAENQQVKPEVLYFLATDPDVGVRGAIARNQATPIQADLVLADDSDEAVRADLAGKIARFAPDLRPDESDRLKAMTYQALETLIQDQAVRVRRVVAETLKDMKTAPPGLIQRLARDAQLSVAGPVLQYSPVLTDEDLLDIVRQLPIPGAAAAIARRRQLGAGVADEIGNGMEVDAITALLSNARAQIREETLDRLIERAPQYPAWHRPLVARPKLSGEAVRKLARFVAADLIGRLQARSDLLPTTIAELQQIVLQRLEQDAERALPPAPPPTAPDGPTKLLAEARRLKIEGKLTEEMLVDALVGGRPTLVLAALSVLATLPLPVIEKILSAHSAKGVVALIWKANLSMAFAVRVQTILARLPTAQMLKPRTDGGFPLSQEALEWQIGFFTDMAAESVSGRAPAR